MLEREGPPAETVKHIDRCLSCLACMTTCPSGVHYMHLVDHGRRHIEEHYRRPLGRAADCGAGSARVLPQPALFRVGARRCGGSARPFARWRPARLRAAAANWRRARSRRRRRSTGPQVFPAAGRAADAGGAAGRLRAAGAGAGDQCRDDPAAHPARLSRSWSRAAAAAAARWPIISARRRGARLGARQYRRLDARLGRSGLDAVVANASGCGTMLKDYGFLFRTDPDYAEKAARDRRASPATSASLGRARSSAPARRRPACGSPTIPPARCSTARRSTASPRRCSPPPGSRSSTCRRGICAAARPAPTTCCSRRLPGAARPQAGQYRRDPGRPGRRRQYRLHDPARAGHRCRSCIRSSCSTGRPAGLSPGMLPSRPEPRAGARWLGRPVPRAACGAKWWMARDRRLPYRDPSGTGTQPRSGVRHAAAAAALRSCSTGSSRDDPEFRRCPMYLARFSYDVLPVKPRPGAGLHPPRGGGRARRGHGGAPAGPADPRRRRRGAAVRGGAVLSFDDLQSPAPLKGRARARTRVPGCAPSARF